MPKSEMKISKSEIDEVPVKNEFDNNSIIEEYSTCHICNEEFHPNDLDLHFATHQVKQEGQILSCEVCDKTFSDKYKLKYHVLDLHIESSRGYPCKSCDKTFLLSRNLEIHNETVHGENMTENLSV